MAASIPIIHNPRLLLGLPCRAAVQTTRLAFTTPGNGLVDYPSHNQVEQQPQQAQNNDGNPDDFVV